MPSAASAVLVLLLPMAGLDPAIGAAPDESNAAAPKAPAPPPARERRDRTGLIYTPESVDRIAADYTAKAAQLYGFDPVQTEAVRAMFAEEFAEYLSWWEVIDRLNIQNCKALARGEVTHEEVREAQTPLIARSTAVLERMRAAFRETMLDDAQRRRFDETELLGRDPLTGDKSVLGRSSGSAEGDPLQRSVKRFTGQGFLEAGWAAWLDKVEVEARLTEAQRTKGRGMLALAKSAAADHRKAKESAYRRLAAEWAAIDKARQEGRAEVDRWQAFRKEGTELTAPLEDIGRRWRADVVALLDDNQKRIVARLERESADLK